MAPNWALGALECGEWTYVMPPTAEKRKKSGKRNAPRLVHETEAQDSESTLGPSSGQVKAAGRGIYSDAFQEYAALCERPAVISITRSAREALSGCVKVVGVWEWAV
jgi:hypothetical protein